MLLVGVGVFVFSTGHFSACYSFLLIFIVMCKFVCVLGRLFGTIRDYDKVLLVLLLTGIYDWLYEECSAGWILFC